MTGMRQSAIEFTINGETIDGILTSPAMRNRPYPAAVVCHPHPLMGGNMESALVVAICRALAGTGIASLRFNFRVRTDTRELARTSAEDVSGAFDLLHRWRDVRPKRCGVAGYSFGAGAIARATGSLVNARGFALVAPPVSSLEESPLMTDNRRKLVVAAENDQIVPASGFERLRNENRGAFEFVLVKNADHLFGLQIREVANLIGAFFSETLT